MTLELQTALERQLKDAVDSGDVNLIVKAQCSIMLGLLDCQRKTAERVKAMVAEREKFAWAGRLVWGFASGGGFAALAWLLHRVGVMV